MKIYGQSHPMSSQRSSIQQKQKKKRDSQSYHLSIQASMSIHVPNHFFSLFHLSYLGADLPIPILLKIVVGKPRQFVILSCWISDRNEIGSAQGFWRCRWYVWECWPPSLGPGTRVIFFHLAGFRLFASGVIFLFGVGSSVSFWRWVVVFVVSAG